MRHLLEKVFFFKLKQWAPSTVWTLNPGIPIYLLFTIYVPLKLPRILLKWSRADTPNLRFCRQFIGILLRNSKKPIVLESVDTVWVRVIVRQQIFGVQMWYRISGTTLLLHVVLQSGC